jgi:endonuclease I
MIARLSSPPNIALKALRQQLGPATQKGVDQLNPVDQVRLLENVEAARREPQGPYFDATANEKAKSAYYGDLPERAGRMSPKELFQELSDKLIGSHSNELNYAPSQHLYPVVDKRPDGQIRSLYAGDDSPGVRAEALIADDFLRAQQERSNNQVSEGNYNCEHVVPQSWFDKKSPMRGDLHHLFACDIQCNSLRGNSLYIDFPAQPEGDCGISDADHKHFEPADGKGAAARATLYFLLRYPGQVGDERGEYTAGDIDMLLQWHKQDPPGEFELHRNAEIALKQGNRNPLIDFPNWAEKIDFKSGLGKWGQRTRQATLAPADYILSCPVSQPFAYLR